MSSTRTFVAPCVLLFMALASPGPRASDVLVIGPGGFDCLQDAVDAAASGDILLLRSPGSHTTIGDKALTLIADRGFSIQITGLRVAGLASHRSVSIVSVELYSGGFPTTCAGVPPVGSASPVPALALEDCAGSVRVEGCNFLVFGTKAARVSGCEDVAFLSCNSITYASGGEAAFEFERSTVAIHGSGFSGGSGPADLIGNSPGDAALQALASEVYVEGSGIFGGGGSPAICVFGGTPVVPSQPGGPGVVLEQSVLRHRAALILGGSGGSGDTCSVDAGPGPDFVSAQSLVVALPGPARSLEAPRTPREGEVFPVTLNGVPGDLAFVLWSEQPDQVWVSSVTSPLLLASPLTLSFVGVVDPTGRAVFMTSYPELGPGVDGRVFHAQPLFLDASSQLALGQAHVSVVLDRSF